MEQKTKSDNIFTKRKCPYCANEINMEAIICQYCGKDLPKVEMEKVVLEKLDVTKLEETYFDKATHISVQKIHLYSKPSIINLKNYICPIEQGTYIAFVKSDDSEVTEDGKTAQPFYVETKDGKAGWCFSGSLLKI